MNVYDSDFAWPAGTKITALRVIQVLPKTTAAAERAADRRGRPDQRPGRAGHRAGRGRRQRVLRGPGGQGDLLPGPGRARAWPCSRCAPARTCTRASSSTCQGCHEPKHRAPPSPEPLPLALQRPPSPIQPDVDGSNPFNYVRLVQPVLDRHCVGLPPGEEGARPERRRSRASTAGRGPTPTWPASTASTSTSRNGSINTGVARRQPHRRRASSAPGPRR